MNVVTTLFLPLFYLQISEVCGLSPTHERTKTKHCFRPADISPSQFADRQNAVQGRSNTGKHTVNRKVYTDYITTYESVSKNLMKEHRCRNCIVAPL